VHDSMPDREQGIRCVKLVLPFLNEEFGGAWSYYPGIAPDENPAWQHIKTPDAFVSSGSIYAAIEVKPLIEDPAFRRYNESHMSLYKRVVPFFGGRYSLYPYAGSTLPMAMALFGQVRDEIERVSRNIPAGGEGVIRLSRQGQVRCISEFEGGPFINCWHVNRSDQFARGPRLQIGSLARSNLEAMPV
jgi:hypothetical protein